MSRKAIFFVFLAFAALILSSCDTCDPGSLVQPDLVSPNWREVVPGSSADLEWSYPDTCEPENFEIILSKDSDYAVIEHTELVPGDSTTWTTPALDTAQQYWWRVRAKVGSSFGGYSGERRSFFTGPYCTASQLVAPNLSLPDFGAIYDNDYDSLVWDWPLYGTCIPESYRVEVSPGSPAFTDTTYNGATGSPGTRWGFGSPPPPATQFYWRITAYSAGVYGPATMHKMFWTAPACESSALVAPLPLTPVHNDIVTDLLPIFTWSYPDTSCTPEGQRILVSDTPDMSSIVFDANSPTIASRAMISHAPLADCGEYYWQISAISGGVEGPSSSVQRFIVDETGMCDCAAGATTIPVQTNPGNYQILPDTDANLRWYNPGGCIPDGAAVQIATDYDFADMNEFTFSGEFVTGYDPPALEPATQYRWKAAYYMEESGSPVIGDYSGPKSFFTGPECTSLAEVVAPVRLSPADGSVITDDYAALKFTPGVPGCIPDGYLLHLHKMADFSDPNLLTEYTLPATTVLTDPLDDCTTYNWSVTAVQDGGYGPESDHGSFYVNKTGACLPPGVPATAKGNFFCKAGTFDEFKNLWTVVDGHRLWAIARNPQTTYLLYTMLDQETKQPFKPEIQCWGWVGKVEAGWPELKDDGQHNFELLRVVNPPDLPEEEEELVCRADLSQKDCEAGGWIFKEICHCR